MDNIIKKVIESETRAQMILAEVEDERKHSAINTEVEIQKLREEIFLSTEKKLEDIRSEKLAQAAAQVEEINAQAYLKAAAMEKKLAEKKAEWVQYLLEKITGR